MGHSSIRYRDDHFWANDGFVEIALALLIDEIDRRTDIPDWLKALRDGWQVQATHAMTGVKSMALDRHVTTDERRDALLQLITSVRDQLLERDVIAKDWLNERELGGDAFWTADIEAWTIRKFADTLLALLRGELPSRDRAGWATYFTTPEH